MEAHMTSKVVENEAREYLKFLQTVINHKKRKDLQVAINELKTEKEKLEKFFSFREVSLEGLESLSSSEVKKCIKIFEKVASDMNLIIVEPSKKLSKHLG